MGGSAVLESEGRVQPPHPVRGDLGDLGLQADSLHPRPHPVPPVIAEELLSGARQRRVLTVLDGGRFASSP